MKRLDQKQLAYLGICFVVLLWGTAPLLTLLFYEYYSPTIRVAFQALVSASALLLLSAKRLKEVDWSYFRVALPTGLFYAAANILQKIGLQYTTPTHYSFLENLSCVVVPLLMLLFTRKKPSGLTMFASVLCLFSMFVLTGVGREQGGTSVLGDVLCALSGVFYGVNIAATGVYAKKLHAPLYLMIQQFTEVVLSLLAAAAFHAVGIEPLRFSFDPWILLLGVLFALTISTLGWLIRTSALKYADASVVAVMMPFSSVVTAVLSVLSGKDALSPSLVIGAILGLTAVILSCLGERPRKSSAR